MRPIRWMGGWVAGRGDREGVVTGTCGARSLHGTIDYTNWYIVAPIYIYKMFDHARVYSSKTIV